MAHPRLNVPLTLENAERLSDGMGGFDLCWRSLGVLWAEMRSGSGRETAGEIGAQSVVPWRITVRAAKAGDPRRPRPQQRLRMGKRLFRIDAVAEHDAAGRWLTCFAREEGLE